MRNSITFRVALLIIIGMLERVDAQVNVTTYHNDNARTGQNLAETTLTPANVNTTQFGKLYSINVDGYVYAQPLILTNVTVPGNASANVLYVATENDSLYAIDATNSFVLWQTSFINPSSGITTIPTSDENCTDIGGSEVGITGTPVIDSTTGTIYLVASTKENGSYVQRLHAVDVTSHAEKFGGPVAIQATVTGTGLASQNGTISFDPLMNNQRAGLLLENGHVVIAWGSNCDQLPYHGWIMSYNAATLSQEAVFSTSPNGSKGGIWMAGAGVAADSNFNIFVPTGDGDYDAASEWGDSILRLAGPNGGAFSVTDWFTPYNQAYMDANNRDVASGGALLLPDLPSGQQLLVQGGKLGTIYLINRNQMGQYCSTCTSSDTQIVQEIQSQVKGLFSMPAFWNGNVYFGGAADYLKAFSFNAGSSGILSSSPTSESAGTFGYPGTTPSISANGAESGIVWAVDNTPFGSSCCQLLHAYDANNLSTEFYDSDQAANNHDVPGGAVKFTVPTVVNGRVYVGSQNNISIYGLFSSVAATPTFSPVGGTYTSAQSVTISDSSAATIYYTTNGSTPTTSSSVYSGPITVTKTTTIQATAAGNGRSASPAGSAIYTITSAAATPTFSPASGTYSSAQSVTISDSSSGTTIYYTIDGSTPTTSSGVYSGPITVSATTTIKAVASGGAFSTSPVGSATYTIASVAATPTFSPAGGTYSSAQSVTISDSSAGTTIYYTTNGSTPTTSSSVYSAPITVSATTTIKAVASGGGFSTSAVGSVTYTIQSAGTPSVVQTSSGYVEDSSSEAVSFSSSVHAGDLLIACAMTWASDTYTVKDSNSNSWNLLAHETNGAGTTTGYCWYAPNSKAGATTVTVTASSKTAIYLIIEEVTGIATSSPLDTFGAATAASGNGSVTTSGSVAQSTEYVMGFFTDWDNDSTWAAGTGYVAEMQINDSAGGASCILEDKSSSALSGKITATASKSLSGDYWVAIVATFKTSTASVAATPTFNPAGGTYSSTQSVTISDGSPGTKIYYTTNGSTPTTSSSVYSGPIAVSATTTIKAIASGGGFSTSAVGSATYTIQTAGTTSVVQKGSGYVEDSNSEAVSLPTSVRAGDLLISCAMTWATDTYAIKDSNSNTWNLIAQQTNGAATTTAYCWYAPNAKTGATAVTVTASSKTAIYLIVQEVTGVVTSSPLDAVGSATAATGNGSVTTTRSVAQSTEYVMAFFTDWENNSTWTAGAGYVVEVQINDSAGGASCILQDESSTSLSGKITATASKSLSGDYWVGIIATFK